MRCALAPATRALLGVALAAFGSALVGCTPAIGNSCTLSTDCSVQGTRLCDTTQPGGYCTMLRCTANSCPDNAACVEFVASVPGCPYDDYGAPSRSARAMCMKTCGSSSDCRQSDGYVCDDPKRDPWGAVILDSNQSEHVCIVAPSQSSGAVASSRDAEVCSSTRPDAPPLESVISAHAGGDAGDDGEAGTEAGEAASDAGEEDGGTEAGDGGESSADVSGEPQEDVTLAGEAGPGAVDGSGGS